MRSAEHRLEAHGAFLWTESRFQTPEGPTSMYNCADERK